MTARNRWSIPAYLFVLGALAASTAEAQVGMGLLDANTASVEELAVLPHLTDELAAKLVAARPYVSVTSLDAALRGAPLGAEQIQDIYGKLFVHVNLNTGSDAEFQLIPGVGKKMAHEFEEYRPWTSWSQFDKVISKYVGQEKTDSFKPYLFIPLNLNTASGEAFMTIPGVGKKMAHEFEEYRPWKSKAQFEKEIGKYVGAEEVARIWRYLVID